MSIIDDFNAAVPDSEKDDWAGMYGASAPYFWAAQTNRIKVPPEAQGFYALPAKDQATWYGVHKENAAVAWARESGATPAAPPGGGYGAKGESTNPAAGTPYKPGEQQAYPTSNVVPGSGRGPGGEPLFGTTRNPFRGTRAGQYSNRMADVLANDTRGWFGSGFIDPGGNRHFLGRDDEGGELGWGPTQMATQRNAATGKMEEAGIRLGREDSGWDPAANNGQGAARRPGAYYGAQPFSFISGKGGLNGLPAAGEGSWVGLNRSYGSGAQGDPTDDAGAFDESKGYGAKGQGNWNKWVHTGRGGGGQYPSWATGGGGAMAPAPPGQGQPEEPAFAGLAPSPGGYGASQYQQPGAGGGGAVGGGGMKVTPQAQLFVGPGVNLEGDWSVLGNLLLRSDTESALNTGGIPQEYGPLISRALQLGVVKATNRGWAFLKEMFNLTPQQVGGRAPQYAQMVGVGADGSGAGTQDYGGQIDADKVASPGESPDTKAPAAPGATPGAPGTTDPRWGVGGTWQEGEATPFGPVKGGLPGGFGLEWNRLIQEMQDAAAKNAIEQAKLTGVFNNMPTLQAKELEAQIAYNARMATVAEMAENRQLQQQTLDEAFRRAEMAQKQSQFESEMGFKKGEATGFVDGQATLAMQELMGNLQQEAYERAANPAMAFQNELARGATGWNNPGQNQAATGIPGLTTPGQNLQQFMQAGGFTQTQQPQQGPTAAQGYGYGTYPGAGYAQGAQAQGAAANAAAACGADGAALPERRRAAGRQPGRGRGPGGADGGGAQPLRRRLRGVRRDGRPRHGPGPDRPGGAAGGPDGRDVQRARPHPGGRQRLQGRHRHQQQRQLRGGPHPHRGRRHGRDHPRAGAPAESEADPQAVPRGPRRGRLLRRGRGHGQGHAGVLRREEGPPGVHVVRGLQHALMSCIGLTSPLLVARPAIPSSLGDDQVVPGHGVPVLAVGLPVEPLVAAVAEEDHVGGGVVPRVLVPVVPVGRRGHFALGADAQEGVAPGRLFVPRVAGTLRPHRNLHSVAVPPAVRSGAGASLCARS